jgi:predicted dehydrogenase
MNKCAIIGCGLIAGGYDAKSSDKVRTHAKAFLGHPSCKLVGVCDIDEVKAKNFANSWDIPFSTSDIESLLLKCKPDILSICSPTDTHLIVFELACRMGVPIIWLEKPASSSLLEAQKMMNIANKYNTQVWVNYFRRYDAGFKKTKQMLTEIGLIQHVQAYYTKGLLHNGSHLIDLLNWFFGKIIEIEIDNIAYDSLYPSPSGVIKTDTVTISLKALDHKKFELFELDIIGSNGRIKILDGGQKIIFENVITNKYYQGYQNLNIEEVHDTSYSQVMLAGLKQGLSGELMPGLENEIEIHKFLQKTIVN